MDDTALDRFLSILCQTKDRNVQTVSNCPTFPKLIPFVMATKNAKGEWNPRHSTAPNLQQKWARSTFQGKINSLTFDILRDWNKARFPSMQSRDSPGEAFPDTAVGFAQTGGFSSAKSLPCFSNKCKPACSKAAPNILHHSWLHKGPI